MAARKSPWRKLKGGSVEATGPTGKRAEVYRADTWGVCPKSRPWAVQVFSGLREVHSDCHTKKANALDDGLAMIGLL